MSIRCGFFLFRVFGRSEKPVIASTPRRPQRNVPRDAGVVATASAIGLVQRAPMVASLARQDIKPYLSGRTTLFSRSQASAAGNIGVSAKTLPKGPGV